MRATIIDCSAHLYLLSASSCRWRDRSPTVIPTSFFAILASVASLLLPTSLAHTFTTPTAHFRHTAAAALRLPSSISGRPPRCTDPHHRRQWSSEGVCRRPPRRWRRRSSYRRWGPRRFSGLRQRCSGRGGQPVGDDSPINARRSVLEVNGHNNEDRAGRRASCSDEDTAERGAGSYCDDAAGRGAGYRAERLRRAGTLQRGCGSRELATPMWMRLGVRCWRGRGRAPWYGRSRRRVLLRRYGRARRRVPRRRLLRRVPWRRATYNGTAPRTNEGRLEVLGRGRRRLEFGGARPRAATGGGSRQAATGGDGWRSAAAGGGGWRSEALGRGRRWRRLGAGGGWRRRPRAAAA